MSAQPLKSISNLHKCRKGEGWFGMLCKFFFVANLATSLCVALIFQPYQEVEKVSCHACTHQALACIFNTSSCWHVLPRVCCLNWKKNWRQMLLPYWIQIVYYIVPTLAQHFAPQMNAWIIAFKVCFHGYLIHLPLISTLSWRVHPLD